MHTKSKLVRDNIPQIILKDNFVPIMHIASAEEYSAKLKEKLSEEVEEFLKSEEIEEIADILEVIYSICEFKQITKEDIESIRKKKADIRGSFEKRIILDKIEKP
jgi:predicted house-cleaning noncanonical NTP pyrophosphatase (MazG superfamily)